jgi:hypothetical protein
MEMDRCPIFLAALALSGCSASQINSYTTSVATTSNSLLVQQTLHNLGAYLDDPASIPAELVVAAGTTSTTNSVSGSITSPLTAGFQTTSVLAEQVGTNLMKAVAPTGATTTTASSSQVTGTPTSQRTLGAAGLSASANNVSGAAYSYVFVTDPEMMLRLHVLYRYVVDWSSDPNGETTFKSAFPLMRKSVGHSVPECTYGRTEEGKLRSPALQNTTITAEDGSVKRIYFCTTSTVTVDKYQHQGSMLSYSTQVADGVYLTGPDCILCGPGDNLPVDAAKHVVHLNPQLSGPWLHWSRLDGNQAAVPTNRVRRDGDVSVGQSGNYEFYVPRSRAESFVRFNIALLNASTQVSAATGAGSAGGGAASQAAKAPTPYDLVLPVQ